MWVLGSNWSPLKEQCLLLIPEPSFQPLPMSYTVFIICLNPIFLFSYLSLLSHMRPTLLAPS